jgi:redox-sensitive bicupin YhaK (pirin superfamily)
MVAGKGVSHSERTSAAARSGPNSLFGIQTWLALPDGDEDVAPSFEHHGRSALPMIEDKGVSARLILGNAYGERAPARIFSETFYADVKLDSLARLPMPDEHEDRAIYVVEGSISVAGQEFGTMQKIHLVELRRLVDGTYRGSHGRMASGKVGRGPFRPSCRRPR